MIQSLFYREIHEDEKVEQALTDGKWKPQVTSCDLIFRLRILTEMEFPDGVGEGSNQITLPEEGMDICWNNKIHFQHKSNSVILCFVIFP